MKTLSKQTPTCPYTNAAEKLNMIPNLSMMMMHQTKPKREKNNKGKERKKGKSVDTHA